MRWEKQETVIPAATEQGIGSGQANTQNIVAFHNTYAGEVAARVCAEYTVTIGSRTYDDWFLPSRIELNAMALNLGTDPYKPASFSIAYYWSSSEDTVTTAWYRFFFGGGSEGPNSKYYSYKVRPVRSF